MTALIFIRLGSGTKSLWGGGWVQPSKEAELYKKMRIAKKRVGVVRLPPVFVLKGYEMLLSQPC